MKKFIFSAIAAIGLLLSPSCSDENEALSGSGNEALVSFSVNLADGIQTKAISDGTKAKNLVVDVFEKNTSGEYIKIDGLRHKKDGEFQDGSLSTTVNFNLVKGKTYRFIFWAQAQSVVNPTNSPYDISDLSTITVNYDAGITDDEDRDAFLHVTNDITVNANFNQTVELHRPFAQLNYLIDKAEYDAAVAAGMGIQKAKVTVAKVAKKLHPLTNSVSEPVENVTFEVTAIPTDFNASPLTGEDHLSLPKVGDTSMNENYYYLASKYFLVYAGDGAADKAVDPATLATTSLKLQDASGDIANYEFKVPAVPVQWNYRTNIYGNLITSQGNFTVNIVPGFNTPDNNLPQSAVTVDNVNEIATAIENGATTIVASENFVLSNDGTTPTEITVPKTYATVNNGVELTFDFSKATVTSGTANITLSYSSDSQHAPENVNVIASGNITIDLEDSHVTLNGNEVSGGTYNTVIASTSGNTLVVPNGVTVEKLIVKKGNVRIEKGGTVKNITSETSEEITVDLEEGGTLVNIPDASTNIIVRRSISTAEGLKAFAAEVNSGKTYAGQTVVLTADIDLNNALWTPIGGNTMSSYPSNKSFAGTFDGQEHTISNLTTSSNQPNYATAGLFGTVLKGATIRNVKLSNVTVSSTHYAGAIVGYHSDGTLTIENCQVDGGTITSTIEQKSNGSYDNGDKAGGIIGYTTSGTVSNCFVNNVTIKAFRDFGGIVGCANGNGVTVTDCTATNISLIQDGTYTYEDKKPNTFDGIVGAQGGNPSVTNNTSSIASVKIINCFADETLEQALSLNAKTIEVNLSGNVELNTSNFYTQRGGESTETITINGNSHTLTCNSTYRNHITTAGAKIVLNNLTMTSNYKPEGSTWDDYAIIFDCPTAISNVTFARQVALSEPYVHSLSNVTINQTAATGDMYALWIEAGADVTITNSLINAINSTDGKKNRAIKIADEYVTDPKLTNLSVSGTTFKSQKKAAVLVTSTAGANITWGEGNNISEVQADTENAVWNDSDRTAAWDLVTVRGCSKKQEE